MPCPTGASWWSSAPTSRCLDATDGLFAWLDVPGVADTTPLAEAAAKRRMLPAPGAMFGLEMAPSTKMRFNVAFCQSDETCRDLEALLNEQALLPTWQFLPQARIFLAIRPFSPREGGREGADRHHVRATRAADFSNAHRLRYRLRSRRRNSR